MKEPPGPQQSMESKSQSCVSAFQTKLNPETQHTLDHQDQGGECESKEKKRHLKVIPGLKNLR